MSKIRSVNPNQLYIAQNAEVSLKLAGNTAQVTFTVGKNKKCPIKNLSKDEISGLPENTNGKDVAKNYKSAGGYEQTIKDFENMDLSDVREINTKYGNGKVGKSNDGSTVVARPGSETGGATLEIRISRNKVIKIRY